MKLLSCDQIHELQHSACRKLERERIRGEHERDYNGRAGEKYSPAL